MKATFWFLCACMFSVTLVQAQSSEAQSSGKQMASGRACYTSCLGDVNGIPTCDPTCTATDGDKVFVDDQGNLTKLANPKEKQAIPSEREREKKLEQDQKDEGLGGA